MCSLKLTRLYYRAKGGIIPYRILIGIDITTRKMSEQLRKRLALEECNRQLKIQANDLMPARAHAQQPEQQQEDTVNLRVRGNDGVDVFFKLKQRTRFCKLLDAYGARQSLHKDQLVFMFQGVQLAEDARPLDLGMRDDDVINVFRPSMDPLEQQGDDTLKLTLFVRDHDGNLMSFLMKPTTHFGRLMRAFCERQSLAMDQVSFLFDGRRVAIEDTPEKLAMEDGDIIDVTLKVAFQRGSARMRVCERGLLVERYFRQHAREHVMLHVLLCMHVCRFGLSRSVRESAAACRTGRMWTSRYTAPC